MTETHNVEEQAASTRVPLFPSLGDSAGMTSENSVLHRKIGDEIDRCGRITFRRFMELALYDSEEGYYFRRAPIGTRGDYLTSPELHPLFGALLKRQFQQMWELLDRPAEFTVIEMGAGTASFARGLLSAGGDQAFDEALRYVIVEHAPMSRELQRRKLGSLASTVTWLPALDALDGPVTGCLFSNELPDSFPVHRVTVEHGSLRELFVGMDGESFVDVAGGPSTPALARYFADAGVMPAEGCDAEVNLASLEWMRSVGRALQRGFVLTLDYGYPARLLYAPWRRRGTLLSFHRHTAGDDPYVHVGEQDLTTHVDFSSLARVGAEVGLSPLGFTSQQRFLAALGIQEALAGGPAAFAVLEEYLARRRAVEQLLNPEGLGRIRVLAQGKGVRDVELTGFIGSTELPEL
jgi:SAM-dependent MidA family methyltransferase